MPLTGSSQRMTGMEIAVRGSRMAAPVGGLRMAAPVGLDASIDVAVSEASYGVALAILVLASLHSAWHVWRGGVVRTA